MEHRGKMVGQQYIVALRCASVFICLDFMDTYTTSQLSLRNGSDREEIWFAYKGTIYDASDSRHWPKGIHYGHWAGQDLTAELKDAPHGDYVFKRLKVIGKLV